jgi:hypothetical protein
MLIEWARRQVAKREKDSAAPYAELLAPVDTARYGDGHELIIHGTADPGLKRVHTLAVADMDVGRGLAR